MDTLQLAALPLWALGPLLVLLPTGLAILASALIRRSVGIERLRLNNEVAGFKFAVVGVIYAVLLGFAVIVVWERFHDAASAVEREASALIALYRLSPGAPAGDQAVLRRALAQYAHSVVDADWPAMSAGHGSASARESLNSLYGAVLAGRPLDPTGTAVQNEEFHQLDTITQARRERIGLAGGIVPGVLWLALLAGAGVTIGFTFFFGVENVVAQMLMTGALSTLIFLGLLVIVAIDRPFTGPVSVPAEPFVAVLDEYGGG